MGKGLVAVGLVWALAFARPAVAQTLSDLVMSSTGDVALPAARILGRADISGSRAIRGVEGTVLAAPEDDAIFAVLPGADLQLSGVALLQEGQSRFGIYLDGGRLELADCRISGAFEVAIYVSAGSLSVRNCDIEGGLYGIQAAPGSTVTLQDVRMTGQGDTALRIDDSALTLKDLAIADPVAAGIVVVSSPRVEADGVTVTGPPGNGIWLQEVALADLTRIVVQVSGHALTAAGGGDLALNGLLLEGGTGAFVADGLTGVVRLAQGRLSAGDGATAAVMSNIGEILVEDVALLGGETGLYLAGTLGEARFGRLLVASQSSTGVFFDTISRPDYAFAIQLDQFRGIGAGGALPAYFRDSGPVVFSSAALLSAGPLPFAMQGISAPRFEASALISAPDWVTGTIAYAAIADDPPSFLPVGDLALLGPDVMRDGTVQLSLADLAQGQSDPEMRREIAAFATGGAHDPQVLALALEFALPKPGPDNTRDTTALTLAPPEAGWVWDGGAVRFSLTGVDGKVLDLAPADFPVTLALGDYLLAVDGKEQGWITVKPGATLEVPLPEAPFYAWRDAEGRKVRGPALYLRGTDDLAALMAGSRPLRLGETWGYAPVFAPRRGADRALAAAVIANGKAEIPDLLAELATLRAAESWPDFNLRWQRIDVILDIMAQFGTREDARWLLDLAIPDDIQINQLETAVLIEMRLGILGDGATLPAARALLSGYTGGDTSRRGDTTRLVQALARTGANEGLEMLASLHLALRSEDVEGPPNATGVIELSRQPPELAGDIPSLFLDRLALEVDDFLSNPPVEGVYGPIGTDLWNSAVAALAHEAIHGGRALPRRLPIPVAAAIGASAWAFAEPQVLLRGPLGETGPRDPQRLNGWTYRLPEILCSALAYRAPADRQAQLNALRLQVANAVTLALVSDEEAGDPARLDGTYRQVLFVLDLILGECVLSDSVLNSFGRDAAGEEQAIFDKLDYEPPWWVRLPRTRAYLESFARGEDFPVLQGHSAIPYADIEALLQGGEGGYPPLKEVFLARHRLVSDAFQSNHDFLSFGSERRQFRLRNDSGNGSVTIAGYLDIRPILSDGRLIIAVRHTIQSPDYGGLAAMITEPDRAPYEAENRIRMFEAVTLDRGGVETAMTHEGTSARGVHFFAAPWDEDLSDTALHLSMRFWDATWEIDVPLWSSTLAHAQRGTRKEAEP